MTPRLSLQLYTVREALGADFDGTIAQLAEAGYRHVEPYGIEKFADELAASLSAHGIDATTTHGSPVSGDVAASIEAAHKVGVTTVIQPGSPRELWTSADGIKQWAQQLNEANEKLRAEGLTLGYHNHEFELIHDIDGGHGLDLLAAETDPSIVFEVDTYWAYAGGADVPALLERLGERVVAIHIKDGPGNMDTKAQVAVGAGQVPVLDFVAAARHITDGVVELDDTSGDMLTAVRDSYNFLTGKGDWA